MIRIILGPPPVEPEHPPINISVIINMYGTAELVQVAKSWVAYPVVVKMLAT